MHTSTNWLVVNEIGLRVRYKNRTTVIVAHDVRTLKRRAWFNLLVISPKASLIAFEDTANSPTFSIAATWSGFVRSQFPV